MATHVGSLKSTCDAVMNTLHHHGSASGRRELFIALETDVYFRPTSALKQLTKRHFQTLVAQCLAIDASRVVDGSCLALHSLLQCLRAFI